MISRFTPVFGVGYIGAILLAITVVLNLSGSSLSPGKLDFI